MLRHSFISFKQANGNFQFVEQTAMWDHAPFLRFYLCLRTVCALLHNKKRTFVYQKFSFCLSKPQATSLRLCISSPREVRCISSAPMGLYLMLVLAHRLHGGTPCYVPSLTKHSQSNRRVAPSCKHGLTHAWLSRAGVYFLRLDDIQGYALILVRHVLLSNR